MKLTLLILALSLSLGAHAAGQGSEATVQYAWFYKPPADGTAVADLVSDYADFILTKNDEATRDALRKAGVATPILQYVRVDAIQDPGNGRCPNDIQPYRNQVAWVKGDFCAIQTSHPDWFLRTTEGTVVAEDDPSNNHTRWVYMDPSNAGWRAYWLTRVKAEQLQGWDGVFMDNINGSLHGFAKKGIRLRDYADDAGWQTAVSGFLTYAHEGFFKPKRHVLSGNIIELPWKAEGTRVWTRYIEDLDGAMQEAFAMGWRSGAWLSVAEWENDLVRMEQTQAMGKRVILVAQGDKSDSARQQFALASYLLVANGRASFRYTNPGTYNQHWRYDDPAAALGHPKGNRYQDGAIWRRDFDGGHVTVDPSSHAATIVLDRESRSPTAVRP